MLIDSDSHVRDALKMFFDNTRTKSLIFKTGEEGLNALKYQNVALVVSDYFLPDMDGIEFLKKTARIQPSAVRVLMATITCEELEKESRMEGIDRFIEKPLTVDALDALINELDHCNR